MQVLENGFYYVDREEKEPLSGWLYLVRHGMTAWNIAGRLQGEADLPLNGRGRDQVARISIVLKDVKPATIYSSDLGRAVETASEIAEFCPDAAFICEQLLSEMRFGELSGLISKKLELEWPGLLEVRERDRWAYRWPGGESYEDVANRVSNFLTAFELAQQLATGDDVVIVGHEVVNKVMIGKLLELSNEDTMMIKQPNTVIYRLRGLEVQMRDVEHENSAWSHGMITSSQSLI